LLPAEVLEFFKDPTESLDGLVEICCLREASDSSLPVLECDQEIRDVAASLTIE
jgi:hypothetical protein